jgi:hypothetical protein
VVRAQNISTTKCFKHLRCKLLGVKLIIQVLCGNHAPRRITGPEA